MIEIRPFELTPNDICVCAEATDGESRRKIDIYIYRGTIEKIKNQIAVRWLKDENGIDERDRELKTDNPDDWANFLENEYGCGHWTYKIEKL